MRIRGSIQFLACVAMLGLGSAVSFGQNSGQDTDERDSNAVCRAADEASLFKSVGRIKTVLSNDGERMPSDCSAEFFVAKIAGDAPRFSAVRPFHWKPTDFVHMPTYFDDVPLERYGQFRHERTQPFVSGARFVLQLPVLPYKMGVDRPHACITTLGHQPPGDCVPCIKQRIPLEADATFLQAAATVGLVFLMP